MILDEEYTEEQTRSGKKLKMPSLVEVEYQDTVATVRLNRPESLNALSTALSHDLFSALADLDGDPQVRVVVIVGAGRAFCAGADLTEMKNSFSSDGLSNLFFDPVFDALAKITKPTIAAVQGIAFGGGCEIALGCDIVVSGKSAQFGLPEVTLGILASGGGTQRLTRSVGKAKAMLMLLTGSAVSAQWAFDAGLVASVVNDDEVLTAAVAIAQKIASNAPVAVRYTLDAARHAALDNADFRLAYERRSFTLLTKTADAQEGIDAFRENRAAVFRAQ